MTLKHVMSLSIEQVFLFNIKKNQAKTTPGNQCLGIHNTYKYLKSKLKFKQQ